MAVKKTKILLVDDEPLIRKLTRATLSKENYVMLEADNGTRALEVIRREKPRIVLLDVVMPEMDGFSVCKAIKESPELKDTHVIILTGQDEKEVKKQLMELGADDFLAKPFSPVALLNKVVTISEGVDRSDLPGSQVFEKNIQHSDEDIRKLGYEQLLMFALDINKIYSMEIAQTQELKQAYQRLRDVEKMKDVFIGLVSHELRTPLSIIKGYIYLVQETLEESPTRDDISQFLGPISRASVRLEELIEELLDFSRMKSGLIFFEKREINIPDFVNLLVKDFQVFFEEKGISLSVDIKTDFRPIKADPARLKEALSHFIKNALSFTPPGGKVWLELRDEGIMVEIAICDTGKGIPGDSVSKIFSPFYQAGDILTREVGGMGLGLTIAKHIIEDHGGNISLETQLDRGTKFFIRLPRSYQDAKEMVAELQKTYPKKIQDLSESLKSTQESLLNYTQELSQAFAREKQKVKELQENLASMEQTYIQTLTALSRFVDLKDAYTSGGHTDRVSFYATALARRSNPELLSDRDFKYSLLLHDIGKIGVADEILSKVEKLTEEEWQILKGHTEKGVELLKEVQFLAPALKVMRSHHERWDGKGYPDGLKGEEIPLIARIIALADAFDAMTTDRPYRKGMSLKDAREEIIRQSGRQFDPGVVAQFLEAWEEIETAMLKKKSLQTPAEDEREET